MQIKDLRSRSNLRALVSLRLNHGKAVYGIRNSLRYGISAQHCMVLLVHIVDCKINPRKRNGIIRNANVWNLQLVCSMESDASRYGICNLFAVWHQCIALYEISRVWNRERGGMI